MAITQAASLKAPITMAFLKISVLQLNFIDPPGNKYLSGYSHTIATFMLGLV